MAMLNQAFDTLMARAGPGSGSGGGEKQGNDRHWQHQQRQQQQQQQQQQWEARRDQGEQLRRLQAEYEGRIRVLSDRASTERARLQRDILAKATSASTAATTVTTVTATKLAMLGAMLGFTVAGAVVMGVAAWAASVVVMTRAICAYDWAVATYGKVRRLWTQLQQESR
ncbi:hypothetical protein OC844_005626 [Tilletia horrida]|nr:hypothetical protein OC844_005626 [Tilletia horrida]